MFHTVAFSQAMVTTNVGTLVTPIVDSTVFISGNNLNIPAGVNNLFGAVPFVTTGGAATNVQAQSPSLRETYFPNLTPIEVGATLDQFPTVFELWDNPVPLVVNEGLNIQSDASSAATAGQQGAIVFLCDGPRTPVTKSKIFTMRATTAITLVANTWVNGAITFSQTLPVGKYAVVGMRAEGTGLLAARLVFIGASAVTRPGCPGSASSHTLDVISFRMGRLGNWGIFDSTTPPSIDALGVTGTSQVLYLDLVQQ